MRAFWLLGLAACGGSPVLSGLPRPDPAVVAAAAAATAGAATLADPKAAAAAQAEHEKRPEEKRPIRGTQMPGDVLDRMDRAERDAGAE